MSKIIEHNIDVEKKLLNGINKTADIVSETMGPVASNIIISENGMLPKVTKDGITVIRAVHLDDPVENAAAMLMKEASGKTNNESGDGTTGTAILLRDIYQNGLKMLTYGGNRIQVRNGISKAAQKAIELLKQKATFISTHDEIFQVAKIASNHSEEIASVLADVFDKIGTRGVIKVEEGSSTETVSKIVEGCQYDTGYLSPFFCTNEQMEADLDSPFTLFCSKKISNYQDLLPLLQSIANAKRPLFIMCNDMDGEALQTLVINKLRGMQLCVVKSPSFGDNRKSILKDLAALTGAKVVDDEAGDKLEEAAVGTVFVGRAKRIIVTRDNTTIISNGDTSEKVAERLKQIDAELKLAEAELDKQDILERRAKLDGGVGVISVGGRTQSEMKEKKDLVDDAFNSVKAALKSGVVPGGGTALYKLIPVMEKWKNSLEAQGIASKSEAAGMSVFIESLVAPIKTILSNAEEQVDVVLNNLHDTDFEAGYDVLNRRYAKLVSEAGIIDPASVIISEVNNASSIAGLLLTSAGAIVDSNDKTAN